MNKNEYPSQFTEFDIGLFLQATDSDRELASLYVSNGAYWGEYVEPYLVDAGIPRLISAHESVERQMMLAVWAIGKKRFEVSRTKYHTARVVNPTVPLDLPKGPVIRQKLR